ncbi:MAG: hypothetical protein V1735_02355 [Nanoarchaeota archaeon]
MNTFSVSGKAEYLDARLCEGGIDALAPSGRIPPEERGDYRAFSLCYQHVLAAHDVEPEDWIVYSRSETGERLFIVPRAEYPDTHAQNRAVRILIPALAVQPT